MDSYTAKTPSDCQGVGHPAKNSISHEGAGGPGAPDGEKPAGRASTGLLGGHSLASLHTPASHGSLYCREPGFWAPQFQIPGPTGRDTSV